MLEYSTIFLNSSSYPTRPKIHGITRWSIVSPISKYFDSCRLLLDFVELCNIITQAD